MAAAELAPFNGTQAPTDGRVDPPLYVGCNGKVFDVSFGGFEMYKPGAGYHRCVRARVLVG
jgi:predicted heme/steroid binding protein